MLKSVTILTPSHDRSSIFIRSISRAGYYATLFYSLTRAGIYNASIKRFYNSIRRHRRYISAAYETFGRWSFILNFILRNALKCKTIHAPIRRMSGVARGINRSDWRSGGNQNPPRSKYRSRESRSLRLPQKGGETRRNDRSVVDASGRLSISFFIYRRSTVTYCDITDSTRCIWLSLARIFSLMGMYNIHC